MNLTKTRSLILALSVLGTFFVIAALLLRQDEHDSITGTPEHDALIAYYKGASPTPTPESRVPTPIPTQDEDASSPSPAASQAKFLLNNFQRSETRDGKKIWEVKAVAGEYFPQNNTAKVSNAQLWFYKESDKNMQIETGEALLYLEGPALKKADAHAGVKLIYSGVTITTAAATYDKEKNTVSAPGSVQVASEMVDITGEELSVDLVSKVVTISKNVESVIKPRNRGEEQ